MLRGKKIRLLPTPEQEILFWKSAGTSRWAYNYFLARNEEQYKTYLANGRKGKKNSSLQLLSRLLIAPSQCLQSLEQCA